MLTYHLITESEKREICCWKYEGEYAAYNLPDYQTMQKKQIGFCNPNRDKNFFSYYDGEVLVGFTNILEEETQVFLGIGVAPDLCGKGYGQKILDAAKSISRSLYPSKPICLEVRCWNKRAVACYQKSGFCIEGEAFEQTTPMGPGLFYRMVDKSSCGAASDCAENIGSFS